jgi:hypothetical protein
VDGFHIAGDRGGDGGGAAGRISCGSSASSLKNPLSRAIKGKIEEIERLA